METTSFFLQHPIVPWEHFATQKASMRKLHGFCVKRPDLYLPNNSDLASVTKILISVLLSFEKGRAFLHVCGDCVVAFQYLSYFGLNFKKTVSSHQNWASCYYLKYEDCAGAPLLQLWKRRKNRFDRIFPVVTDELRTNVDLFHLSILLVVAWSKHLSFTPQTCSTHLAISLPLPWPVEVYRLTSHDRVSGTRKHKFEISVPNFIHLPLR